MAITGINRTTDANLRLATGGFKDTGTVKKTIVRLGFVPRYVKLVNADDRITWEWFDNMPAGTSLKTAANGDRTLDTGDVAITAGNIDSGGTASLWTVYNPSTWVVGTPAVVAAEQTDNSALNAANEVIAGFSIPAAVVTTSKQFYWQAWG